ncbi:MAG TPA: ATP-binding cassette domain-containing protein [Ktedonobacteraceae bacterium]|nr:ATP-binding cassette domain-containing protein [Ktedonobacteraceae bacterium]
MAIIETAQLRKIFKTRYSVVEAVRGVDMRVDEGEIFGFLGPNGAGKTTMLRMLTTLLPPSSGQARVAGCDVQREPARVRERIGYVSQSGGVDNNATGRENLLLQARLYRIDKPAIRAAELLAALELEACADRIARTYSGGQRRRLDVALGMVHRPRLLFLDEPTTGLDPQSRAWLWNEVRSLRAAGTTIFLTTHYLEEADALCDRLAIIDGGRIVAEGTPTALKRSVAHDVITFGLDVYNDTLQRAQDLLRGQPFVHELHASKDELRLYVSQGNTTLPVIMQLCANAGISINSIALAHPTLDDVFLRLTGHSLRDEGPEEHKAAGYDWKAKATGSKKKAGAR